ncbi:unnamed protein product, partial [Oppiella nova]
FLDAICRQFGDTFDDNLRQRLRQLEDKHQSALSARPPPEVRAKSADRAPNSCRKRKYEFACDWIGCEFVTNRKSRLRAHLNRHCGRRPFRCEKCGKEFVGKEALSAHEKAVHSTPTATTCVAIECARRQRRPVVVVREERPFACPSCDYRSRTRQALREHASTHAQR